MKKKLLALMLLIVLSTACSTQNIVIEEMAITDPDQYTMFTTQKISVSTKDSVRGVVLNPRTKKLEEKKMLLKEKPAINYTFEKDSLIINDPYFQSVVGLKAIRDVKFKGVWDNEVGFITEMELNKYKREGVKAFGSGLLGFVVGEAVGMFAGAGLGLLIAGPHPRLDEGLSALFISGLLGTAIGSVIGMVTLPDLISPQYSLDERIEIIKEKRKEKLLDIQRSKQ